MFRKISEGDVYCNFELAAAGPRVAKMPDGTLVCSFNLHQAGGSNDFYPVLSYSKDGENWSEYKPVWPELVNKESIFASVRTTADGRVSIGGQWFPIHEFGESFWSSEVGGMWENCMAAAISDDGVNFPAPQRVELPFYGSAEQPGGMLVDADGTMTMIYAPYPTIEQKQPTDTCQLVMVRSRDGGKTWQSTAFARQEAPCQYGESWIVRLSDGRLMVSTWQNKSEEAPDQYLLSSDDGKTFSGPFAMPFRGQTTALEVWDDGKVLVVYNQRKEEPTGVWLALAKPDENGFNLLENQPVWETLTTTQHGTTGEFDQFIDFAFGEPHALVMDDGSILVTLWYRHGERKGIRYVRLVREEG
ncbi:MAG: exo-alpha-sialidase [Oscillospiraceae bacterium]|nr:exo-alpha-sialidase [Oscillospiraceae bacterium]